MCTIKEKGMYFQSMYPSNHDLFKVKVMGKNNNRMVPKRLQKEQEEKQREDGATRLKRRLEITG